MGPGTILLGNLNPVAVLRNGDPAGVTAAIAECHRQAGARFIVGAGCEVPRDTPAGEPARLVRLRPHPPALIQPPAARVCNLAIGNLAIASSCDPGLPASLA